LQISHPNRRTAAFENLFKIDAGKPAGNACNQNGHEAVHFFAKIVLIFRTVVTGRPLCENKYKSKTYAELSKFCTWTKATPIVSRTKAAHFGASKDLPSIDTENIAVVRIFS